MLILPWYLVCCKARIHTCIRVKYVQSPLIRTGRKTLPVWMWLTLSRMWARSRLSSLLKCMNEKVKVHSQNSTSDSIVLYFWYMYVQTKSSQSFNSYDVQMLVYQKYMIFSMKLQQLFGRNYTILYIISPCFQTVTTKLIYCSLNAQIEIWESCFNLKWMNFFQVIGNEHNFWGTHLCGRNILQHVLYILKCKYILSTIIYVFLGKWSTKDASYFIIMETVVLQCITFIHLVIVPETYLWTFFSFENHM